MVGSEATAAALHLVAIIPLASTRGGGAGAGAGAGAGFDEEVWSSIDNACNVAVVASAAAADGVGGGLGGVRGLGGGEGEGRVSLSLVFVGSEKGVREGGCLGWGLYRWMGGCGLVWVGVGGGESRYMYTIHIELIFMQI
jgi:hypothetical protein